MKNPFSRKKKNNLPIIHIGQPPNTLSGTISVLPSSLSPININSITGICSSGGYYSHLNSGSIGIGIQGASSTAYSFASASTWTSFTPEQALEERKKQLSDEFERNPELFSEIIVELRKRKIKKIKENL